MDNVELEKLPNKSDEISLKELILRTRDWWRYLLSKWAIILITSIIGGAIGLTYAWLKKPTYKAELSFALQDEKSGGGGLSSALGLASQFGIDLGGGAGGEFSGDNLLELMKSRLMVEQALLTSISVNGKNETLVNLYIDFNKFRKKWEGNSRLENINYLPNADRSEFSLTQDSVLGVFYKELIKNNLVVDKLDKKLSIISLSVTSKNEMFSKCFTEVLAKVVSDFYVQTKTQKASKNVKILQKQTDSVRQQLNSAISGVAHSIDASPNPNPSLQTLHVISQRRQVDVQANTVILGELAKNLEIAKMSLLQETPLIQIIDRPILPLEKEKASKLIMLVIGGTIGGAIAVVILLLTNIVKSILKDDR